MRTRIPAFSLALLLLTALACTSWFAGGEQGDPGRDAWVLPDEMGALYAKNCKICHGAELEGRSLGPSLLAETLVHGDSINALVTSIRDGYPERKMPGWADSLPAGDIRGLAIFIAEKRAGGDTDEGRGVGPPPVIPTEPVVTDLHEFMIEPVFGGLTEPYSIAPLPDGRILVTEKMRGLSVIEADGSRATLVTGTPPAYDDSVRRGTTYAGSGWHHEVELHPDYVDNGWIYLSFGDRCEGCNALSRETGEPVTMVKLVRGRLDGTRWIDQETVWEAPKETYLNGIENGAAARVTFDDAGHVFLTVGSITDYQGIQDLDKPVGKIHRVRDDGGVPKDNPFAGVPDAMPSIYTLGHRNPQGIDFNRITKQVWSSEHGPRGGDEGNLIRPGLNYGWPLVSLGADYDGRPISYAKKYGIIFDPAELEPATIDWTPSPGVSSIVFYRGDAFPQWRGHLLVATLSGMDLMRVIVDENGAQETEVVIDRLGRFRDVEVGPAGEIFVLVEHSAGSQVLRLAPTGS